MTSLIYFGLISIVIIIIIKPPAIIINKIPTKLTSSLFNTSPLMLEDFS